MNSPIKPLRSFRFWTILVPRLTMIVSLIGSSTLWIKFGGTTDSTPFLHLVGYSIPCAVITGLFAALHFYLNLWIDERGNSWTGTSYCEKVIEPFLALEKIDWRLRESVVHVVWITAVLSPIGLVINLLGIGIAIIRAGILLIGTFCAFLWSCRPGLEGFENS